MSVLTSYRQYGLVLSFGYNQHYLFWCSNCIQLPPLAALPIGSCLPLLAISKVFFFFEAGPHYWGGPDAPGSSCLFRAPVLRSF